jgi:hypothetical protein
MCEEVTMTPAECEAAAWERFADWCDWIEQLWVDTGGKESTAWRPTIR